MYCSWRWKKIQCSAVVLPFWCRLYKWEHMGFCRHKRAELSTIFFYYFILEGASLAASSPHSANRLWGIDKEVTPAGAKVTIRLILVGPWILSRQTCPQWVNAECCFHQSCWTAHCFLLLFFLFSCFVFFPAQHHWRWNVAAGGCI